MQIHAMPVIVLVHPRPGWVSIALNALPTLGSHFLTLATGLGTILSAVAAFRKKTSDSFAPGSGARAQRSRWIPICSLIVFVILFTFFASNSFHNITGEQTSGAFVNVNVPTGSFPSPAPNSSTVILRDPGSPWGFPSLGAFLIAAFLMIAVVVLFGRANIDHWRLRLAEVISSRAGFGSLSARLSEIQSFAATGQFSKRQMRPFYRALFKELRKKHDVTQEQRRLSATFKRLIDKLVVATQKGSQKWDPLYDSDKNLETSTLRGQDPIDMSHGTDVSRFGTRIDSTANEPITDSIQIEVSEVNNSIRLGILNDEGVVMQILDADSFDIEQETRDQIRRLYGLARAAGLGIETTLKGVISKLDKDIAAETDWIEKDR